ncbi:myosin-binding protein 3-like [Magnolia sinica]|uniref:myosin-binding protein 3-like n=1 Tax=Magnolia sinica TaxID=86752 RepID=UPI002659AA02|nr:myosin-binding protein 3-like [Magnolia sinica]
MAPNKFATMLHRNTHRITVVLVYTVLEWTLIMLLLLNSLFFYLIAKFAAFFGLKPPCPWCSRVDHILEPKNNPNSYKNLLCETHANEISRLGYCSNHRKLVESCNMCEDCSSSRPHQTRPNQHLAFLSLVADQVPGIENGGKDLMCSCCGTSLKSGFFSPYLFIKPSWDVLDYTKKGDLIREKGEEGDDCFGFVENGYSDPSKSDYPSDRDEDGIENGDRVAENQMLSDVSVDECAVEGMETGECLNFEIGSVKSEQDSAIRSCDDTDNLIQVCCKRDRSFEIISECYEKFSEDDRLVPIGLIDSMTMNNQCSSKYEELDGELSDAEPEFPELVPSLVDTGSVLDEGTVRVSVDGIEDNTRSEDIESTGEKMCPLVFLDEDSNGDLVAEVCDLVVIAQAIPTGSASREKIDVPEKSFDESPAFEDVSDMIDIESESIIAQAIPTGSASREKIDVPEKVFDESTVFEEGIDMIYIESKSENFIEREICDVELMDQPQIEELVISSACLQKDLSSENYGSACSSLPCGNVVVDEYQVPDQANEPVIEGGDSCIASKAVLKIELVERINQRENYHLSTLSDLIDAEEERAPETPTYMEGMHTLDKRLMFDRKESGTESLDGSIISEFEGGEALTVDRLKSALRSERKALSALYAELEEERSASAIAANQTMAMITRLQEEKAAMQMEALQYQRMMEEQSEYDQEALQLLNELMVKREKEKQELEKELELYRKKVLLYEAKEKRMKKEKKANMSNGISSASSSAEDSDDLSIDLNEGDDSFYGPQESNHNTPTNEILSFSMELESTKQLSTLDESLANFEEERLSILEQLKALEEKLFTLGGEDENFEDVKSIEHFSEENRNMFGENFEFHGHVVNGVTNGFPDELGINGKHDHEYRNVGSKAKTLLPLFDAISMENEDGLNEEMVFAAVSQDSAATKFSLEKKKLAIEEEVDHVHERLQALEADREFLKHCISSMKKGDKGIDLLQEILQHLRDLRTVELRVRNTGDGLS